MLVGKMKNLFSFRYALIDSRRMRKQRTMKNDIYNQDREGVFFEKSEVSQKPVMPKRKGPPQHFLAGTENFLTSHRILRAWYRVNIPAPSTNLGWFTWDKQMVFETVTNTRQLKKCPATCHYFRIRNNELVEYRSVIQEDGTPLVRLLFWEYDELNRTLILSRTLRRS